MKRKSSLSNIPNEMLLYSHKNNFFMHFLLSSFDILSEIEKRFISSGSKHFQKSRR